jgi:hypothetical protein
MSSYLIQLRGQVNVEELNPMSPHQMTTVPVKDGVVEASIFTVDTDQSGMIGLLRHLHSLGFVILSAVMQPQENF